MPAFHLQIVSPDKVEFEADVESVIVPGEEGYFGVLADHAPLLSTLGEGDLTMRGAGGAHRFRVSGGGFVEVYRNQVVVLARSVQSVEVSPSPAA